MEKLRLILGFIFAVGLMALAVFCGYVAYITPDRPGLGAARSAILLTMACFILFASGMTVMGNLLRLFENVTSRDEPKPDSPSEREAS